MKLNMLVYIRLSPRFSPLFPCTTCGKPVLPYRGSRGLSVSDSLCQIVSNPVQLSPPEVDILRFLFARVKQKICPAKEDCRCPLKDRRLFGLLKYALIRPSQFSRLEHGTTSRPRNPLAHHYSDSRHRRLCPRSENRGTIARWLPAHPWGSAIRPGTAPSDDREVALVTAGQLPGIEACAWPACLQCATSIPG